jgi:hypothetical protein
VRRLAAQSRLVGLCRQRHGADGDTTTNPGTGRGILYPSGGTLHARRTHLSVWIKVGNTGYFYVRVSATKGSRYSAATAPRGRRMARSKQAQHARGSGFLPAVVRGQAHSGCDGPASRIREAEALASRLLNL